MPLASEVRTWHLNLAKCMQRPNGKKRRLDKSAAAPDMALMPDDLSTMPEGEDDFDEEEARRLEDEMSQAMAMNAQLKAMLAAAEAQEEAERQQQQQRGPPRRGPGGPSLMRGAAPPASTQRRAPPGHAKNGGWGGQTHTDHESAIIARDNQILVSKLSSIAIKPTMQTQSRPFKINPARTSQSINQRRKEEEIAKANARLAKALNNVKPSANLAKKSLDKHSREHEKRLRVLERDQPRAALAPPLHAPPLLQPPRQRPSSGAYRPGGVRLERPAFQM